MTKELGDTIPALYANENAPDFDAVIAPAKLFLALQRLDVVHHRDGTRETGLCFGLVEGFEVEIGYFDLTELAGGNRLWRSPRRGARPLLAVHDHRRDQERGSVGTDGNLEIRQREDRNHA